jgi:WD40 repeat protein
MVIRAEAGMGKSVFLARWAAHRAAFPNGPSPTTVLRHAFSVGERASSTQKDMVASLVRQAVFALGPNELGAGEPSDPEHLSFLLGRDRPAGTKLIVVLDGLDEAAEPIDPLPLGRGVYLVASYRAEPGETPDLIENWRKHYADYSEPFEESTLGPLDRAALAQWFTDETGTEYVATDPIVERAMQSSEGLPLFVRYLIPNAVEALRRGDQDPFPQNFSAYANEQLTGLREAVKSGSVRGWSWDAILDLFAILVVAKAPLPVDWVESLVKDRNSASESTLDVLDERVIRWLWQREAGVSFAHPRLAVVFRSLPLLRASRLQSMEESLVRVCAQSWSEPGEGLPVYALDWLPSHLVDLRRDHEAAELLGNGAFQLQRLTKSNTRAMVRKIATETIALSQRIGAANAQLTAWRRFWSENEVSLLKALDLPEVAGSRASEIFQQLASDRFGDPVPADPSWPRPFPRLAQPLGFTKQLLERGAFHREVRGILALSDRLVSWGGDGALRFWSLRGEPLGSIERAHEDGVFGVHALPDDRLVSRGGDGALRFWGLRGEPLASVERAHEDEVEGVLALPDDRLVSWGGDSALRFWSLRGEPLASVERAHEDGVFGVYALSDDRLVSRGGDGALRFWGLRGEPLASVERAHEDGVLGVHALPDRVVSWGGDGALRFWGLRGEPLASVERAHEGWVDDVFALPDRLVSWGTDGALRFWGLRGEPLGGVERAHMGKVEGVLALPDDRLVSWGMDGALCFWSLRGEPLGGVERAHDWVEGVLTLPDRLVSWGMDGALCFWSLRGEPLGGVEGAHVGKVEGVLALPDDRLVSWGTDSALCFWSLRGEPLVAHAGKVEGVLALPDNRLVSWGGDGALRFWSVRGEPLGVERAHAGWVEGVLALPDDRLVSWGGDGALRFWSLRGEPLGGVERAHEDGVLGVHALPDRLVSWGGDGALRFWGLRGEPLGSVERAHEDLVDDVYALPDRLVSWGGDGALRFWGLRGEPLGSIERAHEDGVLDVLALPDRLVSFGWDGALRFWGLHGDELDGGAKRAHVSENQKGGGVLALSDRLVSWGAGGLRLWSLRGEPLGNAEHAHDGGVNYLRALPDRLVSWGTDGVLRFWSFDGMEISPPWFPPSDRPEWFGVLDGALWYGFLGKLFRLELPRIALRVRRQL